MEKDNTFEAYLRRTNLSENTIEVYLWTVKYFEEHYDVITKETLLAYKGYHISAKIKLSQLREK